MSFHQQFFAGQAGHRSRKQPGIKMRGVNSGIRQPAACQGQKLGNSHPPVASDNLAASSSEISESITSSISPATKRSSV